MDPESALAVLAGDAAGALGREATPEGHRQRTGYTILLHATCWYVSARIFSKSLFASYMQVLEGVRTQLDPASCTCPAGAHPTKLDSEYGVEAGVSMLTEAGRAGVARHPEDGARLLAQSPDLDLAAITAYEHHLGMDGTGYPVRRLHPAPHYVSRVVAVCGGYDALRSERCYRPARDHAAALAEIAAARGSAYDAGVAGSFVEMMTKWGGRMVEGRAEA